MLKLTSTWEEVRLFDLQKKPRHVWTSPCHFGPGGGQNWTWTYAHDIKGIESNSHEPNKFLVQFFNAVQISEISSRNFANPRKFESENSKKSSKKTKITSFRCEIKASCTIRNSSELLKTCRFRITERFYAFLVSVWKPIESIFSPARCNYSTSWRFIAQFWAFLRFFKQALFSDNFVGHRADVHFPVFSWFPVKFLESSSQRLAKFRLELSGNWESMQKCTKK